MMRLKKLAGLLIGLAVLILIGVITVSFQNRPDEPITVGPPLPQTEVILPDRYFFRQDDPRWASETIGQTDDTLRAYGCMISSVAMAASNLTKSEITPLELEKSLSEFDGFTNRGWLIWAKLDDATHGRIAGEMYNGPDHAHIDQCLARNFYPVVKIYLNQSLVHWVMVVGATEDDYLVRDPLIGDATDQPVLLSSRADEIHAVRCIVENQ